MRRPFTAIVLLGGLAACSSMSESGSVFRDCDICPEMVALPPGQFIMGSEPAETARPGFPPKAGGNERPAHTVQIDTGLAIGRFEVTRREFSAFVEATGYAASGGCLDFSGSLSSVTINKDLNWRNPGFAQAADEPVLCVSWADAQAYATWLSETTGRSYRLPSEAEWEYAARAGTRTAFPWGDELAAACAFANTRTRAEWLVRNPGGVPPAMHAPCDDGADRPRRVGQYRPNAFGLYDMIGNVFEWTADCYHPSYDGAPADGQPWMDDPKCVFRVMRGGSYSVAAGQSRSATRVGRPASGRAPMLGFRVLRSGGAASAAVMPAPPEAGTAATAGMSLFDRHCRACHTDPSTFKGVYGKSLAAVEKVIREGGANTMSMPAWGTVLSAAEIRLLAEQVREMAGWRDGPQAAGSD